MRVRLGFFACLVALFGAIGAAHATTVVCEPEPGSGPNDESDPPGPYGYHTTNSIPFQQAFDFWYEVTPSAGESINSFMLYTGLQYDSDLDRFLNPYQPDGWTNSFVQDPTYGLQVSWSNVSGSALSGSTTEVFGFDHRNAGVWGSWDTEVNSSTNHSELANGYGYLVHVPGPDEPRPPEVFVATNGANVFPFTNWANASRDIATAVGVVEVAGTVHVTNGIYRLTNEIIVSRSMTIHSMNGPGETVVDAGDAVVTTRCFSLTSTGIVLRGFTIRGGRSTESGGGVLYSIAPAGLVDDCIIESNTAQSGGGLCYAGWEGRVQNCIFRGNQAAVAGGGLCAGGSSSISNCLFVSNVASVCGGGMDIFSGEIADCNIRGNTAQNGGGIITHGGGGIRNSLIAGNTCSGSGGGIYFSAGGEIDSCTMVSNSAGTRGGGVFSTAYVPEDPPGCLYYSHGGSARNTILYGNSAPSGPNYFHEEFNWIYDHVCSIPRPMGNGNIAVTPQFAAGTYRLSSDSPCINAGTNEAWMTGATDLDGGARVTWDVADIGADEFESSALACGFDVARPSGVSPLTNVFSARVQGANLAGTFFRWDFDGNGVDDLSGYGLSVVTNAFSGYTYASVQLTVTNAAGEIAVNRKDNGIRTGPAAVYVSQSGSGAYPYGSWGSSATTLQDAVNVAVDGTVVFVSNGVYRSATETHVDDGVSLVSMGGAAMTIVDGWGSNRCFYLNHERAVVDGFTLRNGKAAYSNFPGGSGGGAFVECGGTIRNCTVVSNTASGTRVSGYGGGGIYCWEGGLVENCLLQGNASAHDGGGIECWRGGIVRNCLIERNATAVGGGGALCEGDSLLESCTIVFNEAGWFGGGTYSWFGGEIRNCIISSNVAPYDEWVGMLVNAAEHEPRRYSHGYFRSCIPEGDPEDPSKDAGNLVADPRFWSQSARDYRLATNSPCIDYGVNGSWMAGALDLEGKPRIINSKVDVGAYEFIPMSLDSDSDGMPDWWEWDWARSLSNMLATADGDEDEFSNLSEYLAGTSPMDPDSFLGLLTPLTKHTAAGIVVQWQSSSNKAYRLERSTNLVIGFTETAAVDIPATPPINVYTDATAVLNGPYAYRILASP